MYCRVDELMEDRCGGEAGARKMRATPVTHANTHRRRQGRWRHKGERENRGTKGKTGVTAEAM